MTQIISVDAGKATLRLQSLELSGARRTELLGLLGRTQLASVNRTFDEQGSPSGSWAPLSAATIAWKKYTGTHKLLQDKGLLKGSIRVQVIGNTAVIGTNVKYARVQQEGFSGTQHVKQYSYTRRNPAGNASGKFTMTAKNGRQMNVTRPTVSGVSFVTVKAHNRTIRIPARPYMVFRPEDQQRLGEATRGYLLQEAA